MVLLPGTGTAGSARRAGAEYAEGRAGAQPASKQDEDRAALTFKEVVHDLRQPFSKLFMASLRRGVQAGSRVLNPASCPTADSSAAQDCSTCHTKLKEVLGKRLPIKGESQEYSFELMQHNAEDRGKRVRVAPCRQGGSGGRQGRGRGAPRLGRAVAQLACTSSVCI